LPVAVLKFAHEGLFWMLNLRLSPSASIAFGTKLYALLAFTAVGALPEIVGF